MAERPDTCLGPYRLVAPIGTGGFATVYRAVDERLDSEVAVKILAENHALDIEIRERFLREAQLLRRVACEAVVPVFDIGETDRAQPYMVLAYADRGDLKTRVVERAGAGQPVTVEDLMTVADVLAAALGRAHRVGLVHRDVKPTNLLIASTRGEARGRPLGRSCLLAHEERLLLGDLGLAKDLNAHSGLTVGGGTEGFNAPEQRTGAGRVDVRADVYGASAVLYWMATRAVPADDGTARSEGLARAGLPPGLAQAIDRGLAPDPEARFPDIETWHRALGTDQPESTRVLSPAPAPGSGHPGSGLPRGGGGRRWRRPGAVALAAATVAAGGWFLRPATDGGSQLDDGRVRVVEQEGELSVAISGPPTVAVGEPASFEGSARGARSFLWFTPDGLMEGDNPLVLTSSEPGPARLTLVAADAAGRTVTVEFAFTVTGPGAG